MAKGKNTPIKSTGAESSAPVIIPKSKTQKFFDKYGVDEMYENSKKEFFTDLNLAIASEYGKKENVITHKK